MCYHGLKSKGHGKDQAGAACVGLGREWGPDSKAKSQRGARTPFPRPWSASQNICWPGVRSWHCERGLRMQAHSQCNIHSWQIKTAISRYTPCNQHLVMLSLSLKWKHTVSFQKHKRSKTKAGIEAVLWPGAESSCALILPLDVYAATTRENAEVSQIKEKFQKAFIQITRPLLGFKENTVILEKPNVFCKLNIFCQMKYLAKQ